MRQQPQEQPKRDYTAILTADESYRLGRLSPGRIQETLDRVEVMSTSSLAESTVEDRLRVVEEGPGAAGVPRPWSQRSPQYDKPLPMPSRTPTPTPTPSPVGRREREVTGSGGDSRVFQSPVLAAGPSPVRALFPQDQQWDEMLADTMDLLDAGDLNNTVDTSIQAEQGTLQAQVQPQAQVQAQKIRVKHLTVQELFDSAPPAHGGHGTTSPRPPSPRLFTASPATKQRLLDAYHSQDADDQPRGPTPLGMADNLESRLSAPKSLMRTVAPTVVTPRAPQVSSDRTTGRERTPSPVERPLTPFTLADMLLPMRASPTGHGTTFSSPTLASPKQVVCTERAGRSSEGTPTGAKSTRPTPTGHQSTRHKGHLGRHKAAASARQLSSRSPAKAGQEGHKGAKTVSPGTKMIDLAERGESAILNLQPKHKLSPSLSPSLSQSKSQSKSPSIKSHPQRHSGEFYSDAMLKQFPRRGNRLDWQVQRRYAVDHFFTPQLFQTGAPDFRVTVPRKGRKWDWQVQRKHQVSHYFVPRRFHHTAAAQRIYTAGEWLREHWQVERRHFVDHFFTPLLFDEYAYGEPMTWFEWYRRDWRVEREYPSEYFFVPSLFDEGDGSTQSQPARSPLSASSSTIRLPAGLFKEARDRQPASPLQRSASPHAGPQRPQRAPHAGPHTTSPHRAIPTQHIRGSPDSDLSYSEAVVGRYKATDSALYEGHDDDDDLYDDAWIDYAEGDLEGEGHVDMTDYDITYAAHDKRQLTPDTASVASIEHKRIRNGSPSPSHSRVSHDSNTTTTSYREPISYDVIDSHLTRHAQPNYLLWDTVISIGPSAVDHDVMVTEAVSLVGGGLPREPTAGVWLSLLGMPMVEALCNVYPFLLADAGCNDKYDEMIRYDVERAVEDPSEQQVLINILQAYCVYDPVVGYAPGMLKTAMTLREELTEEQAFAGLTRIYFAWDQRRLVVPGMDGLREALFIFEAILKDCLPSLSSHLSRHGHSADSYAASWFHALRFNDTIDHDVMTWFLLDGRKAVFSVALALMAINEHRLRSTDDPDEIAFILLHDLCDSHSSESVLDFCHHYYFLEEDWLAELQRHFAASRAQSISDWHTQEVQLVRDETVKIMELLAKLSTRVDSILCDREHLLASGQQGQQELSDLHRLCYEQAYRLHSDDARIIDRQFYDAITSDPEEDDLDLEVDQAAEVGQEEEAVQEEHTERIEQELVDVKMRYAEAMAELDQLRNEVAANQRSSRL